MKYTDEVLEELIIPLRKLRNKGELTDKKFYEMRDVLEKTYTSLSSFFKSIDQDGDFSEGDCKAYFRQYLDEHERLMDIMAHQK